MRHDKDSLLIGMFDLLSAQDAPQPYDNFEVGVDYDYYIDKIIESYSSRFTRRELRSRITFLFEYDIEDRQICKVKDEFSNKIT